MNIESLKTSWTKYDIVQVIDVISSIEEIEKYKNELEVGINLAILKSFLGINELNDPIPSQWYEIQNYPEQKRLFALLAVIFTHHQIIADMAEYTTNDMKGIFKIKPGKQYTNLRSALVESGASPNSFRNKEQVPYDLSNLYSNGNVGKLFRLVIEERLRRIGWDGKDFYKACISLLFHKAISLTEGQFQDWIEGKSLIESKLKYNLKQLEIYKELKASKIDQWLREWDGVDFSENEMRKKPNPYFFMFKIDARLLKRIADVHRRSSEPDRASSEGSIQRSLKQSRSQEINSYIHGGFPWSTISKAQRESPEYKDLRMPGILATAIIANILEPGTERGKKTLKKEDSITIENLGNDFPTIKLPASVFEEKWNPDLKPIEIIDGQHRLWAFDEEEELDGKYELPVIAYHNLDRAWQAYLFYTINIKPVKINTSLGYDLYPLLRTQKWLESSKEGLLFYRENRAQELVEALWSYKVSPWKGRIKMLGEGEGHISQAAFIKAITSSFLKKSASMTSWGAGGLFSDMVKSGVKYQVISWNRSQQAAFLILLWDLISEKLYEFIDDDEKLPNEPIWAKHIRKNEVLADTIEKKHPGFTSKNSFLSRDQGVRGISMFANDMFFLIASSDEWDFNELVWNDDLDDKSIQSESIDIAIKEFKKHKLYSIVLAFASEVIKLDWRTTSADFSDDPSQREKQMKYKGGSGYSEVWKDLVHVFQQSSFDELKKYSLRLGDFLK